MERIHSKVIFTVQHLRDKLFSCSYYSLVGHHKFHALVYIFRLLHNMAPPYLQGLFQYSIDVTGHHDHNPNCLYVPQVQNNYEGQSFIGLSLLCF